MKKFFTFILIILIAISCAAQRQYATYSNVSILDNGYGQSAYYPNVQVKCYETTDSLSVITFVDSANHIYTICGKTIKVENIIIERNNSNITYYYYPYYRVYREPYPSYHYRYVPPFRYNHRPLHNHRQSGNRPPQNHRGGRR